MMNSRSIFVTAIIFVIQSKVMNVMADAQAAEQEIRQKVRSIAEQYIDKEYPRFDSADMKLVIYGEGDVWMVTYKLPPDVLGGTPVVVIDKKTLRVIDSFHPK